MKPFFSIITPTLNEENFLPNLLSDLQKQKEKNFEIIVVDGASQDNTKIKANEFKSSLPLTFFENERGNVSIQRNLGAKHAIGDYLIFLDADSKVAPAFTKKLKRYIDKNKGLFVLPTLQTDDPKTETQFIMDLINIFFEVSQRLGRPFALGSAMVFEKKYFFTIGGFDEKLSFGEDYELARRSFKWGVRAKYIKEVSVIYSLRRIRKEGKLLAYYKFFLSTALYIIQGKTERKLFEYELGGHIYGKTQKNKQSFQSYLESIYEKAKTAFRSILQED